MDRQTDGRTGATLSLFYGGGIKKDSGSVYIYAEDMNCHSLQPRRCISTKNDQSDQGYPS